MTTNWRDRVLASGGDWRADGVCRQVGGEVFYPEKGDSVSTRAAKSVCMGCPVLVDCREYALEAREPFGIWGGMSARDRRRLRAERDRAAGISHPQAANLKGAA